MKHRRLLKRTFRWDTGSISRRWNLTHHLTKFANRSNNNLESLSIGLWESKTLLVLRSFPLFSPKREKSVMPDIKENVRNYRSKTCRPIIPECLINSPKKTPSTQKKLLKWELTEYIDKICSTMKREEVITNRNTRLLAKSSNFREETPITVPKKTTSPIWETKPKFTRMLPSKPFLRTRNPPCLPLNTTSPSWTLPKSLFIKRPTISSMSLKSYNSSSKLNPQSTIPKSMISCTRPWGISRT